MNIRDIIKIIILWEEYYMKSGKGIIILALLFTFLITGCASEEDIAMAQSVSQQINEIGDVNLDKANAIYEVQKTYDALTDKQKKLVDNYQTLVGAADILEGLIIEEEIKKDPTNTITKEELIGIWEEDDTSDTHRDYFYFTKEGYIYYMGSKSKPKQSDFTGEYIISTSFELGEYNRSTRVKDGSFYCIPKKTDYNFTVSKVASGEMTLEVLGGMAKGTYHKTGEKINTTPKQCLHSDCNKMAVDSGDSRYCEVHSNMCAICGCYIDEDAMFCLNCIVEALRQSEEN